MSGAGWCSSVSPLVREGALEGRGRFAEEGEAGLRETKPGTVVLPDVPRRGEPGNDDRPQRSLTPTRWTVTSRGSGRALRGDSFRSSWSHAGIEIYGRPSEAALVDDCSTPRESGPTVDALDPSSCEGSCACSRADRAGTGARARARITDILGCARPEEARVPEGGHILGAGPPVTAPEAEPGRRGLMFGILVYRLLSVVLMALLAAASEFRSGLDDGAVPCRDRLLGRGDLARAGLGSAVGAMGRPRDLLRRARRSAPFLLVPGEVGRQPFFVAPYAVSTVMTWAAARGVVGGAGAAAVLAIPLASARWLNGTDWSELGFDDVLSIVTGVAYYVLAGIVIGLFTQTLDRAAASLRTANEAAATERERAARLRERETLARAIHDSVLQSLGAGASTRTGAGRARAGRSRGRRGARRARGPAGARAPHAAARRARGATLRHGAVADRARGRGVRDQRRRGVGEHGGTGVGAGRAPRPRCRRRCGRRSRTSSSTHPRSERRSSARPRTGASSVSIRDDGVGFDVDALPDASGDHFGIARSIRGRIEDLGGAVRIESAPGRGTEVEIRMPHLEEDTP